MINTTIKDVELKFNTHAEVFAPRNIDKGTLAMLSKVEFAPDSMVLDLGCGYGVVGILAAKQLDEKNVIMCDISQTAVDLSNENAKLNDLNNMDIRLSDVYSNISENNFTLILSNPPYHSDFSVAKKIVEGAFQKLVCGGKIIMVTKRLTWYKNKLTSIFGGVKIFEIDDYYVFISEKRNNKIVQRPKKQKTLSKKLQRKYGVKKNE